MTLGLLFVLGLLVLPIDSSAASVVSGTANIWLSGMPNGTTENCCDSAPGQSPVLVPIAWFPGLALEFLATGLSSNGPCCVPVGPDGYGSLVRAGNYGMSGISAPISALVGVFLDANQPDAFVAPASLDFSTAASRDYLDISPALRQVFFIGDGLTSGLTQQFVKAPNGTTRLFLGVTDGVEWNNNIGALDVNISEINRAPEPASLLLMAVGGLLAIVLRARKMA